MARIFKYQEQTWEDPGENFSNEDVKKHLTQFFPELAQASIETKKLDDGQEEVRFVKRAGTKGSEANYQAQLVDILRMMAYPTFLRVGDERWVNIARITDINAACVAPGCITLDGDTQVVLCDAEANAFLNWVMDNDLDIRDDGEPPAQDATTLLNVEVDLVDILNQAADQVWGSDERMILRKWLARNTERPQLVKLNLTYRTSGQEEA